VNTLLQPQPGDFACVPMGGDEGIAVSLAERLAGAGRSAEYGHAFVYMGELDIRPGSAWLHGSGGRGCYVIEAAPGGAHWRSLGDDPLARYGDSGLWSTGALVLADAQRTAVSNAAIMALGTPYSWLDYAWLAAHHLHIPVPGLRASIAASGSMICSQYVDWCYQSAGIHLFAGGRWTGDVMPSDLAALIVQWRHPSKPGGSWLS